MSIQCPVIETREEGEVRAKIFDRFQNRRDFVIAAGGLREKARRVKAEVAADGDKAFYRCRAGSGRADGFQQRKGQSERRGLQKVASIHERSE